MKNASDPYAQTRSQEEHRLKEALAQEAQRAGEFQQTDIKNILINDARMQQAENIFSQKISQDVHNAHQDN